MTIHEILHQIINIPVFPYLWIPHCIIMCLAVKSTIGSRNLDRTSPLSVFLLSVLYSYPGGILAAFILGNPILAFLTNTNQFLSFIITWYLMFYTRINIFINNITLTFLLIAQDLMRLNLVVSGVNSILDIHPDHLMYPVVFATIKSSGFMVIKYVENCVLNGLSAPFKIPHHSAKTLIISATLLVLQQQGKISIDRETLLMMLSLALMILRIVTTILQSCKGFDPYETVERGFCNISFGAEEQVDVNENVEDKKEK